MFLIELRKKLCNGANTYPHVVAQGKQVIVSADDKETSAVNSAGDELVVIGITADMDGICLRDNQQSFKNGFRSDWGTLAITRGKPFNRCVGILLRFQRWRPLSGGSQESSQATVLDIP